MEKKSVSGDINKIVGAIIGIAIFLIWTSLGYLVAIIPSCGERPAPANLTLGQDADAYAYREISEELDISEGKRTFAVGLMW